MAVWSIVKKSELEGALRLDAEYYWPKYIDAVLAVTAYGNTKRLVEIANVLRGRNPNNYTEQGIPVIRAIDLRDITDLSNVLYADSNERLFYLHNEDVLISSIGAGSIGKVELFSDFNGKATTVSEVSVVRITDGRFKPEMLSIFLRSRYGYLQLERRITGSTGQLHLYPKDIGTVLVPMFDEGFQVQVTKTFKDSISLLKQSKSLYCQAEEMLLKQLGLDKLKFSQPKYWTVKLSQAREAHRIDAEHFQPKYDKLIRHLIKTTSKKELGDIASYIKRGVQPRYVEGGEVLVINSRYVGRQLINTDQAERTDIAFWEENPRARVNKYDVIMNSTGWGTIGRTNCVLHDEKTVVDNHVTIIRPQENVCNPVYSAVYLDSMPGLMQTEKWLSGSSGQIEIYPTNIARFVVPILPQSFQQKIADLVIKSHQARQQAKALLEEAKQKVEAVIEGRN